jgi:hypothetical protein
MRKSLLTLGVVAVVALLATSTFAANRGVEFTGIGFIDDPGPWPASSIFSASPDGNVFMANPAAWGNYCVKYTLDGGWGEHIGNSSGRCHITNDGEVAGGGYTHPSGDPWPGYWLGTVDAWDYIPDAGGDDCGTKQSVHGASDNIEYLVGLGWEGCDGRRLFYERSSDTASILGCMDEESCRINDVTDDGNKTVGWNYALCGAWRGTDDVDGTYDWIDGLGTLQRKYCETGEACCGNYDCPTFVDAFCDEQCIDNVCGPGPNEGMACTSNWQCDGYCVNGANHGQECTSSYYCPDDDVCLDNPEFDPMEMEFYKGEGYRTTPDGAYTLGFEFGQSPYDWSDPLYDWTLFSSAYRENPDGSFTQIAPPESGFPGDSWTPLNISTDGNVVVGRYGWWIYSFATLWTEYTGTLDLQYFLIGQGLDELWFWYLDSANVVTVNGDETLIAGYGANYENPDCPSMWGCTEGWIADISKIKVCHKPFEGNERTLTIALESAGDHLGHGDFLGTCAFKNSGGNARFASEIRGERSTAAGAQGPEDPRTEVTTEITVHRFTE